MSVDSGGGSTTLLGKDLVCDGHITTPGDAIVAGTINGNLGVRGKLHLVLGGVVKGSVKAGDAKIDGTVEGPVTVSGRLEVGPSARITGDLRASQVAIAEGSLVRGSLNSHTSADERDEVEEPETVGAGS